MQINLGTINYFTKPLLGASMTKEFICMSETVTQTQKVIRQWLSTGYTIEFLAQSSTTDGLGNTTVVTSLFRIKE